MTQTVKPDLEKSISDEADMLFAHCEGQAAYDPLVARVVPPYGDQHLAWAFRLGWRLENFLHLETGR